LITFAFNLIELTKKVNMKKAVLMLAVGGLMLVTPSCKKGENDPFMSLSSRTGRIAGDWSMTAGSWTTTDTYEWGGEDYEDTDVYTYDGTTMTVSSTTKNVTTNTSFTTTSTYTYSQSATFEKDGAYSSSTTADGNTSTAEGFWYFAGKSKTADMKKKEAVIVSHTSETWGGNTTTYSGSAISPDGFMMLDKLTGKEMVVLVDWSTTDSDGDVYGSTGTMTFEKN
jgi:hypothetical protein